MTDDKTPGVTFRATVVRVVAHMYVASFGPVCWIGAVAARPGCALYHFYTLSWCSSLGSAEGWAWINKDGGTWVDLSSGLGKWLYSPKARSIDAATKTEWR